MDLINHRKNLLAIFNSALQAVNGRTRVRDYLLAHSVVRHPLYVVAIGKAASAMAEGAFEMMPSQITRALVITKTGHGDAHLFKSHSVTVLESAHPLPDQRSLQAGAALLDFMRDAPPDAHFLFLISGGTSSLVEVLPDGLTLAALAQVNQWLLGSGLDIQHVNCVRKATSLIKGGRLALYLKERTTDALLMSDVPGDHPADIGSGLLVADDECAPRVSSIDMPHEIRALIRRAGRFRHPASGGTCTSLHGGCSSAVGAGMRKNREKAPVAPTANHPCFARIKTHIIASNEDACRAAEIHAQKLGYTVHRRADIITGDTIEVARAQAHMLKEGAAGLYIGGGETTIQLPLAPGRGGRNQSLALAVAQEIADCGNIVFLAAGTDGSDGPTADAGAIVDGATIQRGQNNGGDAASCLMRADAGTFLAASGDLIDTGPTGTNVMDLMLGLKTV